MQNVVGKFSRTPGEVKSTGPRLGAHNREILVEMLGYDGAAGGGRISLDPAPEIGTPTVAKEETR